MSPPSEQTILVTGASGFVASHVIHALLAAGYNVRGTLRSKAAIPSLTAAQGSLASRLSFTIVPNASALGALDEALEGVSGVIHTASPFILSPKNNEEDVVKPAISMTTNVLAAAAAHPQVKRVVVTSSFAAILDLGAGFRPGYIYTEHDWNPVTYQEAVDTTSGAIAYSGSKKLAEEAAWKWVEEHKPAFSLATISPPWIFGPSIYPITDLDHLSESLDVIWKLVNGSTKSVPGPDFAGFADVRDVALAHLKAYEIEAAGGQRYLVGGHFDYQSAVDGIRKNFPELKDRVPAGTPGAVPETYLPDGSKAIRELGLKYTPLEVTMKDMVQGLLDAEKRLGLTIA